MDGGERDISWRDHSCALSFLYFYPCQTHGMPSPFVTAIIRSQWKGWEDMVLVLTEYIRKEIVRLVHVYICLFLGQFSPQDMQC